MGVQVGEQLVEMLLMVLSHGLDAVFHSRIGEILSELGAFLVSKGLMLELIRKIGQALGLDRRAHLGLILIHGNGTSFDRFTILFWEDTPLFILGKPEQTQDLRFFMADFNNSFEGTPIPPAHIGGGKAGHQSKLIAPEDTLSAKPAEFG
jgi:hypothetical protein